MFPGTIDRAADERISSVPLPDAGPMPAAPPLPLAQRGRKPNNTSATVATWVFFSVGVVLFLVTGLQDSPRGFLIRCLIWGVIFGPFALFCKFETPSDFLQVAIFFFLATLFEVSVIAGAVALAGFILHMVMTWGSPAKESPREPERKASNGPPLLPTREPEKEASNERPRLPAEVESDGLWIKGVYLRVALAILGGCAAAVMIWALFKAKPSTPKAQAEHRERKTERSHFAVDPKPVPAISPVAFRPDNVRMFLQADAAGILDGTVHNETGLWIEMVRLKIETTRWHRTYDVHVITPNNSTERFTIDTGVPFINVDRFYVLDVRYGR